jgi:hypothetical protein
VCRDDARIHPFVLEVYESGGTHYGLAVEDAIHCGVCKPKPDPVLMEFLDTAPTPRPPSKRKRAQL